MLFKKAPEKFWDLFSAMYAATPITDRAAYETKIEKIKTYLSSENIALDIGCGTGTQCGDLAGKLKHVTGIDISGKLLKIAEQRTAERRLDNVEFIQTSLFDERFLPESFDVIMAFYVVHFFEDIDAAFSRIHSLLKPGGLFISETACLGEKNKTMVNLLSFAARLGFMPLINPLTTAQLERALDQAGFSLLEKNIFSESNSEYTLLARKAIN